MILDGYALPIAARREDCMARHGRVRSGPAPEPGGYVDALQRFTSPAGSVFD